MVKNIALYEGCGNRLLIAELSCLNKNDSKLRRRLASEGIARNADSVMVLTGGPEDYSANKYHIKMDVFEPRGKESGQIGSWSTMCGNGIRAVVSYLIDNNRLSFGEDKCYVKTGSGIREVGILNNNKYRVCMGEFTNESTDLKKYIKNFYFEALLSGRSEIESVAAGLNGDRHSAIDGEPHLALFLKEREVSLKRLEKFAIELGFGIINRKDYFPEEINLNLVSLSFQDDKLIEVNACTYERGVNYVTKACGTGATVIGSLLFRRYSSLREVKVNMPGGTLIVEKKGKKFFLTGDARPVSV